MSRITLRNDDIENVVFKVLDLVTENNLSFTVYNITEIVRSTDVFVLHSRVKELFQEYVLPENYGVTPITVNDDGTVANLFTPINFDIPENLRVDITIHNFDEIIEEFTEWFNEEYHLGVEEPSESIEETKEEEKKPDIEALVRILTELGIRF